LPCRVSPRITPPSLCVAGHASRSRWRWRERSPEKPETSLRQPPEAGGNHAGNHRYGPSESEPDPVLIPMSFAERRRVELNNHGGANKIAERLNATANQTVKAAIVAAQDGIINLLSKRHTAQL